ncbi:MAG: N-6 DNA methylase [Bacteroidota bacterium]|nr:MAG: N-6 DNA methylase [Bacteroidota bacterium]
MLDTPTKKRIDDCRDILVGKLPDPKAQIEQITIALIYKFMDDMDKEAVELGAKAKFFSGNFEKYSWDSLFDTKVTANEMLALYSEAITSMDKNPNIPQLFRDIFKNAFLPYRDPETLKLFLKTIGEFEYTHSEKLGDAFEYLLSVMGSQGDAGQFRTPRHIIDFLVAAVDPQKTDTILDPACGTAGFLISAFKHITAERHAERPSSHSELVSESLTSELPTLKQVQGDVKLFQGDPMGVGLTPDERRRIISNFTGYDISPDMVRLSLVNLYLHGFSDPHIWEYDTLSSEDRWNETFDVILANPPFMSPKGGIRPHKKFSISSNRSEVLFVDYIAEHLNPKGRAGIIVPEGVIFQSGTAYKDLRKMLVDNYLYAVVSLPAGVFNPYSGVKTSILLMDKEFAKTSEEILFVKIDNDGYGLGAQRNAVKGGQLEQAIEIIKTFRSHTEQHTSHSEQHTSHTEQHTSHSELVSESLTSEPPTLKQVQGDGKTIAHAVPKSEIAKNGDYNLSGERYKSQIEINSDWPLVELKELCNILNGYAFNASQFNNSKEGIPVIRIRDINSGFSETYYNGEYDNKFIVNNDDLLIGMDGDFKTILWSNGNALLNQRVCKLYDFKRTLKEYVFLMIQKSLDVIHSKTFAVTVKHLSSKQIEAIKIPLPPISIQEEIVAEIEGYQKIIDGAKMVVSTYKPKIEVDADWEMVELGEVFQKVNDNILPENIEHKTINYIGLENIDQGTGMLVGNYQANPKEIKSTKIVFRKGDILYGKLRPNLNKVYYSEIEGICSTDIFVIRAKKSIFSKLYSSYFLSEQFNQEVLKGIKGAQLPRVGYESFSKIFIPNPPLEAQQQIVSQIEKEQELVNANKQLIELFEQKIKDRIAKVWGEDKTVKLNERDLSIAAEPESQYK